MVVVLKQSCIIHRSGGNSDVRTFSNECPNMVKVPIVDSKLAYYYRFTIKTYLLIISNVLYRPSMENNITLPFLMYEAGLLVNDLSRINCVEDMYHKSHSIIFQEENIGLRIPLRLDEIFSYFPTQSLTPEEIENIVHVE